MELVSLAKEALQNAAEHAASYRLGQSVLRHLDRVLWVVEKCARWAVPPPLDQDERPQPELIRPLPWVFFLMLLIALRITRESVSLLNLAMGKPPLRSADVVMFIQSKRRYLRTLKYQGNRMMRARSCSSQPRDPWYSRLQSLFEFTMCFRRQSLNYGNNNTTRVSNNDEVLVVKRSKRRQNSSPVASTSETTMERLIEKMMVDLDAESDEDSSFTLTTITSPKSDRSDYTIESDQDTVFHNDASTPTKPDANASQKVEEIHFSPSNDIASSTFENDENTNDHSQQTAQCEELTAPVEPEILSPKEQSQIFIQKETATPQKIQVPKIEKKIANGKTAKSVSPKKKGMQRERRHPSEVPTVSVSAGNKSF